MVALGYTIVGIAQVLNSILWLFWVLIIARVIVSWVNADPYNALVRIIVQSTDPLLRLFRRLPLQLGGIDLSPLVAILVILFLQTALVNTLLYYGSALVGSAIRG